MRDVHGAFPCMVSIQSSGGATGHFRYVTSDHRLMSDISGTVNQMDEPSSDGFSQRPPPIQDVFGGQGSAPPQPVARLDCKRPQSVDLRPSSLRIYEISGTWRNTTPIVNATQKAELLLVRIQVGESLNVHIWSEQQPIHSKRAEHVKRRRLSSTPHSGELLSAELLDDDFLDGTLSLWDGTDSQ